jgi:hypothetical protein
MATRSKPKKTETDADELARLLEEADALEARVATSSRKVDEHLQNARAAREGLTRFVKKYG